MHNLDYIMIYIYYHYSSTYHRLIYLPHDLTSFPTCYTHRQYIHVGLYKYLDKQKVFEGTLLQFKEDILPLEYMDKTRKKEIDIPYSLVSKARLAVKF